MIHPDRFREERPSRRDFLIGLGVLGTGAMTCACGGAFGLWAWQNRQRTGRIIEVTTTPIANAAIPRYPDMTPRQVWGALAPNLAARNETGLYSDINRNGWREYPAEQIREIYKTVVVHHSVIDEGDDNLTMLEVQNAHREDRGWADVGYHYLVGKSGRVFEGRDVQVRGTHVGGFNTGSVGVCLLGNFVTAFPTEAQINAARELIRWLREALALTHLAGHQDFNTGTQCPGTNLMDYLGNFADYAGLTIGTEGYVPPGEDGTEGAFFPSCDCCDCAVYS